MIQLESLCASVACEEKAKVERSYSHSKNTEWEPVRLWSMSLGVRIFCSFTPKKKQCECGFELVRLWSMWRKGQSEACVLKLTLTLAFVPRTGIEPALPCDNQILSLARLPVPPSGLGGAKISKSKGFNKQKRVFCYPIYSAANRRCKYFCW